STCGWSAVAKDPLSTPIGCHGPSLRVDKKTGAGRKGSVPASLNRSPLYGSAVSESKMRCIAAMMEGSLSEVMLFKQPDPLNQMRSALGLPMRRRSRNTASTLPPSAAVPAAQVENSRAVGSDLPSVKPHSHMPSLHLKVSAKAARSVSVAACEP